jgi:D-alanine-D-alanine ligase
MNRSDDPGVVVLYNHSSGLYKGEPEDMVAENDVITCAREIAEVLAKHYRVALVPIRSIAEVALAPYNPSEWIVFNLGEGVEGRLYEEARIALALETMGYCFTGAGGNAILHTTHKYMTKEYLWQAGLSTPRGWLFRDADDVGGKFCFPLIVKPVAEDASYGIGTGAVISDLKALKERVQYIVERYRQVALVEEFICGREFNVSIWNEPPTALPINEIDFDDISNPCERIVSFAAKWEPESFDYQHIQRICPAPVSQDLYRRIKETALGAWHAFDCKGYIRVDIRMDANENLYIIDVNCNPDLALDGSFYRSSTAAGYSYEEMVLKILAMAMQTRDQNGNLPAFRSPTSLPQDQVVSSIDPSPRHV